MSYWNSSTAQSRIQKWMEFRAEISGLEVWDQAQATAEYFRNFPLGAWTVDPYDPQTWPTPWEILHHQTYCRNSGGILMHDTLVIINKSATVELVLVDDSEDIYLAPLIEKHCILNMVLGEISNLDRHPEVKIIERFHDAAPREF